MSLLRTSVMSGDSYYFSIETNSFFSNGFPKVSSNLNQIFLSVPLTSCVVKK